MATKQAVWGIDVGQCALKAVKLQAVGDKVEILAYDVVEHEKILSHPEVDAPALIKAALEKFTSRNDLKGDLVAVAVPGQQTLSRFTKLPPVEPKKIPDIVKFEAGQQIPFDMDEVVWDYQTFSEPDSPDVEVGIFAIRKELIRNHIEYFTRAGIEPMLVQASPLALYNAVRFDKPAGDRATILLDVGAQATDLIVIEGSSIWARPVPIGGNAFTEALVKAFKLSHAKAENLKRTAATTKYARQVFQAMRPVFADLIAEVQRSIGFYTATHRESQVARIIGVGNAFKLPGLQKFMQQNLQIEVERFSSFARVAPSTATGAADFADTAGSLVVAYGLALQGLGLSSVTSTLLPPEVAKHLIWQKKQPLFWAAAACLALTGGVIWGANVKAQGTIASVIGTSDGGAIGSKEQAEAILRGSSISPPRVYAGQVNKAVQFLSGEYQRIEAEGQGQSELLGLFQTLGKNVPLVPRIYATLHDALVAEAPGLPGATDGQDYLNKIEEAKQKRDELLKSGTPATDASIKKLNEIIERKQRREIWVDQFVMEYAPDLGPIVGELKIGEQRALTPEEVQAVATHSGWLVSFQARTTRPDAAGWLDDVVLPRIQRDGCKPDTGFYVFKATLRENMRLTDASGGGAVSAPGGPGTGGGMLPPVGMGSGPRGGPRGMPGSGMGGPSATPAAPQKEYEVPPGCDPLTLEPYVNSDSVFIVDVIVLKENVPAERLAKLAAATNKADAAKPEAPGTTPPKRGE